ncbi:MAG: hypothetical protein JO140_02170 [Candidatus Eremiobacteraeota bacterium]|nr:hypothetical protein [Candidatus Eremiobacteraeota bacterium]
MFFDPAAAALVVALATPRPRPTAAPTPAAASLYAGDLFSRRARRRAAIMLRLRWEELRMAELERVRAAIKRELPLDELLRGGEPPAKR